jgi:hypothetical protein
MRFQSVESQIATGTGAATDAGKEKDWLPSVTDPGSVFRFQLSAFDLNLSTSSSISVFQLSAFPFFRFHHRVANARRTRQHH